MAIRFGGACCCGCTYLLDDFDRSGDLLDEDGVNVPDSDRYQFTLGEWVVSGGKLNSLSNGSGIVFINRENGRLYDVSVDVTLVASGDYAKIKVDNHEVHAYMASSSTFRMTMHNGIEIIEKYEAGVSLPYTREITFGIVHQDVTGGSHHCSGDYVTMTHSLNLGCAQGQSYLSSIFMCDDGLAHPRTYSLQANSGVSFDNLHVTRAYDEDCDQPERAGSLPCDLICGTIPPTFVFEETDNINLTTVCCGTGYNSCRFACNLAYNSCNAAATSCIEYLNCEEQRFQCFKTCIENNTQFIVGCPCADKNGTYVLDLQAETGSPFIPRMHCTFASDPINFQGESCPSGYEVTSCAAGISGSGMRLSLAIYSSYYDCKDNNASLIGFSSVSNSFLSSCGASSNIVSWNTLCNGGNLWNTDGAFSNLSYIPRWPENIFFPELCSCGAGGGLCEGNNYHYCGDCVSTRYEFNCETISSGNCFSIIPAHTRNTVHCDGKFQ